MRVKMKNKKKAVKLAPEDYVNTLIWFWRGFGVGICSTKILPTIQGPIPVCGFGGATTSSCLLPTRGKNSLRRYKSRTNSQVYIHYLCISAFCAILFVKSNKLAINQTLLCTTTQSGRNAIFWGSLEYWVHLDI